MGVRRYRARYLHCWVECRIQGLAKPLFQKLNNIWQSNAQRLCR